MRSNGPQTGARAGGEGAPAIEVSGVVRRYRTKRGGDRVALRGVSVSVNRGEHVALLGPNGSGKSTLLRILATLDRADEGHVTIFGDPPLGASLRAIRERIGVAFQSPGLDELLTIRENLMAQSSLFGLRGRVAEARVGEVSSLLQISDRLNERVGTLSGGLERRVDLARALLHEPSLLLLDEPTTGLDHRARMSFLDVLDEISRRDPSLTTVMTTHLMDEAERADRVVMLHEGAVAAVDSPDALRRSIGRVVLRIQQPYGQERSEAAIRLLDEAGLSHEIESGEAIVCRDLEESSLDGDLLGALARIGVSFQVGPPTLGDVYLTKTGRSLDGLERSGSTGSTEGKHRG